LIIIRQSSFKATPWKNGGGTTHEALRVPAQGDRFRWRISVAEVAASGPFSDFSGYWRSMTLLRGGGLHLKFANGTETALREVGDLVQFDGALAAHCDLLEGACTDLNLIVAKTITDLKVRVQELREPLAVESPAAEVLVVFAVSGSIGLKGPDRQTGILSPWDLAVVNWPGAFDTMLNSLEDRTPARAFLASFKDA
jgi:uncharacterized protein